MVSVLNSPLQLHAACTCSSPRHHPRQEAVNCEIVCTKMQETCVRNLQGVFDQTRMTVPAIRAEHQVDAASAVNFCFTRAYNKCNLEGSKTRRHLCTACVTSRRAAPSLLSETHVRANTSVHSGLERYDRRYCARGPRDDSTPLQQNFGLMKSDEFSLQLAFDNISVDNDVMKTLNTNNLQHVSISSNVLRARKRSAAMRPCVDRTKAIAAPERMQEQQQDTIRLLDLDNAEQSRLEQTDAFKELVALNRQKQSVNRPQKVRSPRPSAAQPATMPRLYMHLVAGRETRLSPKPHVR